MTPLEHQLAALLREWHDAYKLEYGMFKTPPRIVLQTRDALALYNQMAQGISREQPETR